MLRLFCKQADGSLSTRSALQKLLQADLVKLGDRVPEHMVVPIPEGKPVGALGTVLELSRLVCMKRYVKPILTEQGWREALMNFRDVILLTKEQEAVFQGTWLPEFS